MLTNSVKWIEKIEMKKDEVLFEKELILIMDVDTPIEAVKEFALRLIKTSGQMEDNAKAAAQAAVQEVNEEVKIEESQPLCEA